MSVINVLILGDVVRNPGTNHLQKNLYQFKKKNNIDFTIVNGENSGNCGAIDLSAASNLFDAGADVITTGNHSYRSTDSSKLYESYKYVLRPLNFPEILPGEGAVIYEILGVRFLVFNILGTVDMEPLESPFDAADKVLKKYTGQYDFSILDFHAEATSEKKAMGYYLDGKVDVVFGTHTHVETADEKFLPKGTAYITGIGMCGPEESVLGIDPKLIIDKLRLHIPVKFQTPKDSINTAHGIICRFDTEKKKCISIERIKF